MKITCPNCGAQCADSLPRCSYCGSLFAGAACWYKAYEGRSEAERYLADMQQAESDMGPLAFVAEDIRGALEIE